MEECIKASSIAFLETNYASYNCFDSWTIIVNKLPTKH